MFYEQGNIIDQVAIYTKNATENFLVPLFSFVTNVKK